MDVEVGAGRREGLKGGIGEGRVGEGLSEESGEEEGAGGLHRRVRWRGIVRRWESSKSKVLHPSRARLSSAPPPRHVMSLLNTLRQRPSCRPHLHIQHLSTRHVIPRIALRPQWLRSSPLQPTFKRLASEAAASARTRATRPLNMLPNQAMLTPNSSPQIPLQNQHIPCRHPHNPLHRFPPHLHRRPLRGRNLPVRTCPPLVSRPL